MRTKDEILRAGIVDIENPKYNPQAHLWLEYRKLEALLDIRDIFNSWPEPMDTINSMLDDGG